MWYTYLVNISRIISYCNPRLSQAFEIPCNGSPSDIFRKAADSLLKTSKHCIKINLMIKFYKLF